MRSSSILILCLVLSLLYVSLASYVLIANREAEIAYGKRAMTWERGRTMLAERGWKLLSVREQYVGYSRILITEVTVGFSRYRKHPDPGKRLRVIWGSGRTYAEAVMDAINNSQYGHGE